MDQHGCAKNQVDGEILISRLESLGMVRTDEPEKAELIIINTCGFIQSAKEESLDSLMQARSAYPDAKILLAGCLAERYADVFKTELKEADGIFGNGDLSLIDGTVASLFEGKRPVVKAEQKGVCCGTRNTLLNYAGSAFVKITEGCDNRCTFCAIPIIRGSLRSRRADDIVAEIRGLVAQGVKEINLIGQDLAAYGCGKTDDVFGDGTTGYDAMYKSLKEPLFLQGGGLQSDESLQNSGAQQSGVSLQTAGDQQSDKSPHPTTSFLLGLLKRISAIEGDFWVRLLYIHPDHFNPDILDFMKNDSRFLPYFDIPFQSGSGDIIKAMNRKGTSASYTKLIQTIRSAFPESCIRTTFLTGFPGESDAHAQETQAFLEAIQSDWSGCFTYSAEDDTPAAKLKGKVRAKAAMQRAENLKAIQAEITKKRLSMRTGQTYKVLIEEIVENAEGTDEGLAIGRAWFEAPEVDGNVVVRYDLDDAKAVQAVKPGAFVRAKAFASSDVDMDAELVL